MMASKWKSAGTEFGNCVDNIRGGKWRSPGRTGFIVREKSGKHRRPRRRVAARWTMSFLSFGPGGWDFFETAAKRAERDARAGEPGIDMNDLVEPVLTVSRGSLKRPNLSNPGSVKGGYLYRSQMTRAEECSLGFRASTEFLTSPSCGGSFHTFKGTKFGGQWPEMMPSRRPDRLGDGAVEERAVSGIDRFIETPAQRSGAIPDVAACNGNWLALNELASLLDDWIRGVWAATSFRHSDLDAWRHCGQKVRGRGSEPGRF